MEPGGTLRLKNFSGRVTIAASDRSGSRHRRGSPGAAVATGPHQARHPHRRIERRDRGRQPARPFLGASSPAATTSYETDFDIKVPRRTNGSMSSVFSSPVDVERRRRVARGPRLLGTRLALNDVAGLDHRPTPSAASVSDSCRNRGHPTGPSTWTPSAVTSELHVPEQRPRHASPSTLVQRPPELGDAAHPAHRPSRGRATADLGGGGDGRCSASRPSAAASRSTA